MSINMQEWREETTAIVNELLADGSNADMDYEIEHHFACQDFDQLEKAAVDLFKADLLLSSIYDSIQRGRRT